jgi:PAS domain S-box-containing protein
MAVIDRPGQPLKRGARRDRPIVGVERGKIARLCEPNRTGVSTVSRPACPVALASWIQPASSTVGPSALAARFTPPEQQHANRAPGGGSARGPDDGYAHVFWTAFRRSANAMFVVDIDRRIVAVNDAGTALAGRSAEALTGERITTFLDEPAEAPDDAVWRAMVLRGESFVHRRIRRPDGSTRVVDFAMRASRAGGSVLVLGVCIRGRAGGRSAPAHEPAPLTTREQEIVRRIALGDVTPDICAALHIAPDTVRTHVRNAMAKTGARTRAQLIAIALTEGLLDD